MVHPAGTSAANGFRETAAALALLAMVAANLLAGPMPLSGVFGLMTADRAALCQPAGAPAGDDTPDHPHHNNLCCVTHQFAGTALVPTVGTLAVPIVVAADTLRRADPPAAANRPHTDSRPRAPPLAA